MTRSTFRSPTAAGWPFARAAVVPLFFVACSSSGGSGAGPDVSGDDAAGDTDVAAGETDVAAGEPDGTSAEPETEVGAGEPDETSAEPDSDAVGAEVADAEPDVPPETGCCSGAFACGPGTQCVAGAGGEALGCGIVPAPGECWADGDCEQGESCHGAALCPCGSDCDMAYEGPGICVVPGGACTAVDATHVEEVCDAKALFLFDGESCVATCPGCCGCKGFCDLVFESKGACEAACVPGAACQVFGGTCDTALPEKPWYYFDGETCQMEDSCVCEGCPGTFATLWDCEKACLF